MNTARALFTYLMNFTNETIHQLSKKALKKKAKIVVDYFIEESRCELLEEKLPSELIKSYPAYLPRFVDCSRTRLGGMGCLLSS